MITYTLLLLVEGVVIILTRPFTVLPDVSLPAGVTSALATIGGWFGLIWGAIPLTLLSLFAAIGTIIVIENNIAIYKLARWVYSKIPGVN